MKNRIAVASIIGLIAIGPLRAGAVPPARLQSLPNFDKRTEALPSAPVKAGQSAAMPQPQQQAANTLKSEVPGAKISRDRILGMPRFVGVTHGFLTGPGGVGGAVSAAALAAIPTNESHRVVKAFLNQNAALFGHNASVLASTRTRRDYVTKHNGLHTTVWQQTLDDIPVFDALLVAHVTKAGQLVSISDHFVPDPANAAAAGAPNARALIAKPPIPAARAVALAASDIGAKVPEETVAAASVPQGAEKKQILKAPNLRGPVYAQLVWLPMNQASMRLCWRVILGSVSKVPQYLVVLDAQTGEILVRRCLTADDITPATYNVYTSDSPSPFSPGWSSPNPTQPPYTNRVLVDLPALDTNASPIGWVDEGPNPTTSGNNAYAFLDRNLDGVPDVPLPVGTNRLFDSALDLTRDPHVYANASTIQLFYRANWYHDRLYDLGFTEAAGNFQNDNFNRGGYGNDAIECFVQAGADIGYDNNSMFSTPPDGIPGMCYMFVFNGPSPARDGALDQEVVCHELTHGLSSRLLGGGVGIYQLQTEGMGEGWSDFYSLCLLSEPTDDVNACYAEGGYATYDFYGLTDNYYFGIRRYPYTTDMSKNPLTFKDIDPSQADPHVGVPINPVIGGGNPSEVHNQGEVWCVTLREVWASLVTKWGWDVGNQMVLQLVTDGLTLAPANATYLEARDAIIEADLIDTGGANYDEIWIAFAKRGMGYSATCPPSYTTTGVKEAFDVPPDVITGVEIPIGVIRVKVTPPSATALFANDNVPIYVRLTDGVAVTNATIDATLSTGGTIDFHNDGSAPDARAEDSIYSGYLAVPASGASVTINMVITAPDEDTNITSVTYYIVQAPPNDDFTNATKVPTAGSTYLTSNQRATLEPNEPVHDGVSSAAASLWWNYTPSANTNVLVDTGGSDFRSIVVVYTNNTLAGLQPVVADAGSAVRNGAYVYFTGRAGFTYHIAVAGYDTNNVGTVRLNIAPGGIPDTNPPTITISSPLDGIVSGSQRLLVTGSAADPAGTSTGIRDIIVSVVPTPGMGPTLTTVIVPPQSVSGPLETNWSTLVGLPPGLNVVRAVANDFAGNQSAPATIQATYRPLDPGNDFFVNAFVLTNASGVDVVNTTKATREAGEPYHAGVFGGHSVWWSFTSTNDGVLTLSTSNSTFDTVLAMYTGTNVAALTPVAANDDAYSGAPGGYSQIIQAVQANQTYHIAVDGYDGQSGVAYLEYSFAPATIYTVTAASTTGGAVAPASANVASNGTIVVSATADPGYQFDYWDGSIVSSNDPLSLVVTNNMNLTAHFSPIPLTDGFESGDLHHIGWTTAGNRSWFVQTNVVAAGHYAARSGIIGDSQSSSLILSTNFQEGAGSFAFRVSSEANFDFLQFYMDGTLLQQWSGEVGWGNYAFTVSPGIHTLEWRYIKDPSVVSGLDAAFIDNVILPLAGPVGPPAPSQLQFLTQDGGGYRINLQGQTNQVYVLQSSADMIHWTNVSTNMAVNGVLSVPVPAGTNQSQFYRAVLAQ